MLPSALFSRSYSVNHSYIRDLESLNNLSNIKKDQVVDIYDNGTVSAPYESTTCLSGVWRTARYLSGQGNNRDDIPKIKSLMQRALSYYLAGDENVKFRLEGSIKGLTYLRAHYKEKNIVGTCEQIDAIVAFVEKGLQTSPDQFKPLLNNALKTKLNNLEASCVCLPAKAGVKDAQEGINYYRDRIQQFLLLEKDMLSPGDVQFLTWIDHALSQTNKGRIGAWDFYEQVHLKTQALMKEGAKDWKEAWDQAYTLEKNRVTKQLLDDLDAMPMEYQSMIGIPIPMTFHWTDNESGHPSGHLFFLNLCKEEDGTYTGAQVNSGAFALGEITGTSWHLNFNVPTSVSLPPIVEFMPLTPEEAIKFAARGKQNCDRTFEHLKDAVKAYVKLFLFIGSKYTSERIPPRRAQVMGNCGIRSVKELLIYYFQKGEKIELANRFLTYVDARSGETLPFEPVQPLKDAGLGFIKLSE